MNASPENTGPGAFLTDGEVLFEVTDARPRRVRAGERVMTIEERRLVDVRVPCDPVAAAGDVRGRWVPMADVLPLEVVRAQPYDCDRAVSRAA